MVCLLPFLDYVDVDVAEIRGPVTQCYILTTFITGSERDQLT